MIHNFINLYIFVFIIYIFSSNYSDHITYYTYMQEPEDN